MLLVGFTKEVNFDSLSEKKKKESGRLSKYLIVHREKALVLYISFVPCTDHLKKGADSCNSWQ